MRTRTRRRLVLLALVGLWLGGLDDRVGAAPVPAAARLSILCGDVCGSGASCGDECWLTQFDFDNEYPPTTCGDEGYSCCGDNWCDVPIEGCSSATCEDDCGDVSSSCGPGGCSGGDVENGSNECVPVAPEEPKPGGTCGGECTTNDDCCGNDRCNSLYGSQGYCAIPSTTYCTSSPSCNSDLDCDNWAASQAGSQQCTAKAVFCDPGIDRCQFVQGFDCPASGNICQ